MREVANTTVARKAALLEGRLVRHAVAAAVALLLALAVMPARSAAATVALVMIEDPGCPYCRRWDAEVRPAYLASAEGRFAPLERHFRGDPAVSRFQGVVYSPTFIVVRDGEEVGRIVGYAGPDFFWAALTQLLQRAGFQPHEPSAADTRR